MKIIKWITGIIISLILVSCDTYSTNDLIQEGAEIKLKYSLELNGLIIIADSLAEKPCVNYQISTSKTTNYFAFEEFVYNKERDIILSGEVFNYDENLEKKIGDIIPREHITNFNFVKNGFVIFFLGSIRDKKLNYASLIYCINKEKFFKLFPDYKVYNEETINELKDITENWVYFYDNNWAITTSSTVYKMSKEECNQIMME